MCVLYPPTLATGEDDKKGGSTRHSLGVSFALRGIGSLHKLLAWGDSSGCVLLDRRLIGKRFVTLVRQDKQKLLV